MNRTTRNINLALCFSLILLMGTSCKKWLDVKPKTEIESSDLFTDENGFKEALAGTYTGITTSNLYGRNLSFGMLDAMAQYWGITSFYHPYFYVSNYQYDVAETKVVIDSIWGGMYNGIANANNILKEIDARKSVFKGDNYAIIKGEALAIRALLHFDLLRMFTTADVAAGTPAIPYVTELSKKITKQSTSQEVINLAIKDLEAAAELLKADPLFTGKEIVREDDNGYLLNRNYHLNYYAVKGLMARIYLYSGVKDKALAAAQEVINAHNQKGLFPWVIGQDVTNPQKNLRDRTFSTEHLFALNVRKMVDYIQPFFKAGEQIMGARETPVISEIYEGFQEYRQVFFETVGPKADVSTKFWQEEGSITQKPKRDRMPMIRLSEMYYIAAECKSSNVADAVEYLNEVRRHRGIEVDLPGTLNPGELKTEIYKEYKKEFVGEGQLYFYHKRMRDATIANKAVNYVFPMPDLEIEYGNRK